MHPSCVIMSTIGIRDVKSRHYYYNKDMLLLFVFV